MKLTLTLFKLKLEQMHLKSNAWKVDWCRLVGEIKTITFNSIDIGMHVL